MRHNYVLLATSGSGSPVLKNSLHDCTAYCELSSCAVFLWDGRFLKENVAFPFIPCFLGMRRDRTTFNITPG
jgi:hypothetical protein